MAAIRSRVVTWISAGWQDRLSIDFLPRTTVESSDAFRLAPDGSRLPLRIVDSAVVPYRGRIFYEGKGFLWGWRHQRIYTFAPPIAVWCPTIKNPLGSNPGAEHSRRRLSLSEITTPGLVSVRLRTSTVFVSEMCIDFQWNL